MAQPLDSPNVDATIPIRHVHHLDAWQRCLRHLVGVAIRELDRPMDLQAELHVPPPRVFVQLSLCVGQHLISAVVSVKSQAFVEASAPELLYRGEIMSATANPSWSFEPLHISAPMGALRSVRLTVRHQESITGEPLSRCNMRFDGPIVFDRVVIFADLVHLVTEPALLTFLPKQTLLLRFDDGICVDRSALKALAAANMLVPTPLRSHTLCEYGHGLERVESWVRPRFLVCRTCRRPFLVCRKYASPCHRNSHICVSTCGLPFYAAASSYLVLRE